MRISLAILLLLFYYLNVSAQSGYTRATMIMSDSLNSDYRSEFASLPALLIKGFLEGNLKGYRGDVMPVVNSDDQPPAWKANVTYRHGVIVSYKDKFYQLSAENSKNKKPNANNSGWQEISADAIPASQYRFPDEADELSRSGYEQRLVMSETPSVIWDSTKSYNYGTVVRYKGEYYTAVDDNVKERPSPESVAWVVTIGKEIISIDYLEWFSIVEYFEAQKADTLFYPQTISFGFYVFGDENRELITFQWRDVIRYLESLAHQPVMSSSPYKLRCTIGALYTNEDDFATNLFNRVQSQVRSDKASMPSIKVYNNILFDRYVMHYLGFSDEKLSAFIRYNHGEPMTVNLVHGTETFASVPYQAVAKSLESEMSNHCTLYSYASALASNHYKPRGRQLIKISDNSSSIRKVDAISPEVCMFLIHQYTNIHDTLISPVFSTPGQEFPRLAFAAVKAGALPVYEEFDVSKIELNKPLTYDDLIQNLRSSVVNMEHPDVEEIVEADPSSIDQIGIVYKVSFNVNDFKPSFEALAVSLRYWRNETLADIAYFKLKDLEDYFRTNPSASGSRMIEVIRKNEVSLFESNVISSILKIK